MPINLIKKLFLKIKSFFKRYKNVIKPSFNRFINKIACIATVIGYAVGVIFVKILKNLKAKQEEVNKNVKANHKNNKNANKFN